MKKFQTALTAIFATTLLTASMAHADTQALPQMSCGLDAYQKKASSIREFKKWEYGAVAVPLVSGGLCLYILAEGGGAEGPVVGACAGLVLVGLGEHYIIKGVKHIEAKGVDEVVNNITEALNPNLNQKDLAHTMDKMGLSYSDPAEQLKVRNAIIEAANDGELCNSQGKLLTKGDFRKVLESHLNGEKSAKLADAASAGVQMASAGSEVKADQGADPTAVKSDDASDCCTAPSKAVIKSSAISGE
jgi:hypothetical protein